MTNPLQDHLRHKLLQHLVGRQITCPRTGEVLDVRTCVVFVDSDGDPTAVLSQKGWRQIATNADSILDRLADAGLTVDPLTIRYEQGERVLVDGEHPGTVALHSASHPDVVHVRPDFGTDRVRVHPNRLVFQEA